MPPTSLGPKPISFHHLTRANDPDFVNAPISVHSTGIPIVCSSVQEAEYAGTFAAAKIGAGERQVLENLGYPQPPTVIHCDNEVAVGLAQKSVKPKLSKSCDMRLHWRRTVWLSCSTSCATSRAPSTWRTILPSLCPCIGTNFWLPSFPPIWAALRLGLG